MNNKLLLYFLILILNFVLDENSLLFGQSVKGSPVRIILSSSMFQNTKSEDVEATTKILAGELNKERRDEFDFKIITSNSQAELDNSAEDKFDLLYISPIEYLKLKKKFSIEPGLVTQINNNYGDIYFLITSKRKNIKEIKELVNCHIIVLSKTEDQVPSLWLDKILKDDHLPIKTKFFKKISFENKATNVVLPIFFNKVDAAIVTAASYELLCELNPQIKKDLSILKISKPFIRALFCLDGRSKNEDRKNYLIDYMSRIHQGTYGKQLTELYMFDKLIPFKKEYLDNILELYK
jgi:ABC-type phosphate/phosphonate transport system substrate-binding protein